MRPPSLFLFEIRFLQLITINKDVKKYSILANLFETDPKRQLPKSCKDFLKQDLELTEFDLEYDQQVKGSLIPNFQQKKEYL